MQEFYYVYFVIINKLTNNIIFMKKNARKDYRIDKKLKIVLYYYERNTTLCDSQVFYKICQLIIKIEKVFIVEKKQHIK